MSAPINTILFDWDGTLNDSDAKGYAAFQKSLAEIGVEFTREFYEEHYTPSWYVMYEALRLPAEQWERADELWVHHYGEEPALLIEGARETVLELHRRGYRLGVVSSGNHCRVLREVEEAGLTQVFQAVVCNEHMTNKKPHPEGLEHALRLLGSAPRASAYVGDVPEDIQMGKGAGVLTVGVRSTFPSSKHLMSAGPDIYLDSIDELLEHFPVLG
jgi:HAD superfamily hydrolase (TIGR01509 family)